ncbi:MAG TPA: oligosaccharide flippase family protein [Anaerolineales bacterium]|nr:oligosaccharide flippase family protein [Anaerolineales bacterium]
MKIIDRLYQKETKETIWSFATKLAAAVLFVVLNAYLARTLGPDLWGSWSFLLSILTVVILLAHLGLNNAARAYAARYVGTETLRRVLRASLTLRIAASAVFTALFVLLHEPLAAWIDRPDLAAPLRAAAPLVFLMGFAEYLKQLFTGLHRLKFHLLTNLVEFGSKIAFSVLLLRIAVALENLVLAFWLAVGLSVLVGMVVWRRFYLDPGAAGAAPVSLPPDEPDLLIRILRYSLPLFVISIGFAVLTEIDTLMLGLLSTDFEVGQFAIAKQLANKLPQFALALSMGTMPGFARMAPENMEVMRTRFKGVLRLNALAFVPGGLLLVLLAPRLIPLVFGPEYTGAVLPLQILTLWVVLSSFNMFFNALLDYQGRAARRARNFILTIFLTIALNLVLIPRFGAAGAAIATTVSFLPYVVLNLLEVREIFERSETIPPQAA